MEILLLIPLFIIGSIFTIILIAVVFSKSVLKAAKPHQRMDSGARGWDAGSARRTGELMYKENATDEIHCSDGGKGHLEDLEDKFREANIEYSNRSTRTRRK